MLRTETLETLETLTTTGDWTQPEVPEARTMHSAMVTQVVQTMRAQFNEPLSLEDMADMACLSPYYFSRVFRSITGIAPGEFLSALRLEAARRLLLTTSLSVTDICFEVGYSGLGSFTTRFTQLVGVPPRLLRHLASNTSIPPLNLVNDEQKIGFPSLATDARGLFGRVYTPRAFSGVIFIGLFAKPIPQGRPISCTKLVAPGPFHIASVPPGQYYVLSAAFPLSENPHVYLLPGDSLMVGAQGPVLVSQAGISKPVEIHLHPARSTDPPIIAALPYISSVAQQAGKNLQ